MTLKDDASFVVSEQSFEPPQKKPLRKQEPSTKKISRIPVSTRSLNKRKTSIAKQDTRAIKGGFKIDFYNYDFSTTINQIHAYDLSISYNSI